MREASPGEFEQLRRAHFNTENNIKLLGIVVMLCAFALLLIGVETSDDLPTKVLFAVLGGGLGLGGWWLRRLDLRGRGIYQFVFDDARAVWVEEVCEDPYFEEDEAPCEDVVFWEFGFTYLKMALEPGRRYRARIEAPYPGPMSHTFLPMLGAEP